MSPKISIIIPSYNEEKNISRCLDSILSQTFSDFEVLCVDDGSNDNTFDIIKEYSKKDNRIIPMKNPEKGVSSARNFGINNANGNYIGFVDSDDFIQPQMYEFLYRAIIENKCDFSVFLNLYSVQNGFSAVFIRFNSQIGTIFHKNHLKSKFFIKSMPKNKKILAISKSL